MSTAIAANPDVMAPTCQTCRDNVEVTAQEVVMGTRYGDTETTVDLAAIAAQAASIWADPDLLNEAVPNTCAARNRHDH